MKTEKGKVVNINHGDSYDVYIGRAGKGENGYFGNPFTEGTRTEKIKKFKEYAQQRIQDDDKYREEVKKLIDKRLGCFCHPAPCHGDVLLKLARQIIVEDDIFNSKENV